MKNLIVLTLFAILISNSLQGQNTATITKVTDSVYYCGYSILYTNIYATVTGYAVGDTFQIKTLFGDGTFESYPVYWNNGVNGNQMNLWWIANHTYLNNGVYDVTYILECPGGISDTLIVPHNMIVGATCDTVTIIRYVDMNSNCIYELGVDTLLSSPLVQVFNGATHYYDLWPFYSNTFTVPHGYNYTAMIGSAYTGYVLTCPSSGIVNFTPTGNDTLYFAFNCNNDFDLSIAFFPYKIKSSSTSVVTCYIRDVSCLPVSGNYSITLDQNLSYVYPGFCS